MRDMIVFIFYFKCNIEKSNTYDRKPKKVSKQLNFFHFYDRGALLSYFRVLRYSINQLHRNIKGMFYFEKLNYLFGK